MIICYVRSGYHSTHKHTNNVFKCNRMSLCNGENLQNSNFESVSMLLEMSKSMF